MFKCFSCSHQKSERNQKTVQEQHYNRRIYIKYFPSPRYFFGTDTKYSALKYHTGVRLPSAAGLKNCLMGFAAHDRVPVTCNLWCTVVLISLASCNSRHRHLFCLDGCCQRSSTQYWLHHSFPKISQKTEVFHCHLLILISKCWFPFISLPSISAEHNSLQNFFTINLCDITEALSKCITSGRTQRLSTLSVYFCILP